MVWLCRECSSTIATARQQVLQKPLLHEESKPRDGVSKTSHILLSCGPSSRVTCMGAQGKVWPGVTLGGRGVPWDRGSTSVSTFWSFPPALYPSQGGQTVVHQQEPHILLDGGQRPSASGGLWECFVKRVCSNVTWVGNNEYSWTNQVLKDSLLVREAPVRRVGCGGGWTVGAGKPLL